MVESFARAGDCRLSRGYGAISLRHSAMNVGEPFYAAHGSEECVMGQVDDITDQRTTCTARSRER